MLANKEPILNSVKLLLKDPAGSKTIYNVLTQFKNYEPICIRRWDRLLSNNNIHWLNIFGWSFKCTNNVQLNVFQYKLIHNIFSINSFLKKIGISQTDICRFCKTDVETILHVFIGCQIISWLNHNVNVDIRFSPEYIIFRIDHDFTTVEIILLIKSTIYTHLQKGKLISFETIKPKIFEYIQTLFYSATEYNTHEKFIQKWEKYRCCRPTRIIKLTTRAAELFVSMFHSFEAGFSKAITSFK